MIDARTVRTVLRDLDGDLRMRAIDAAVAVEPEPVAIEPALEPEPAHEPEPAAILETPARSFIPRTSRWLEIADPATIAPEPATLDPIMADPEPQPVTVAVDAAADAAASDRLAVLEARLEEQDVALRRVLTLLVDWVEGEKPGAAVTDSGTGSEYVPIRGAAAWGDAA